MRQILPHKVANAGHARNPMNPHVHYSHGAAETLFCEFRRLVRRIKQRDSVQCCKAILCSVGGAGGCFVDDELRRDEFKPVQGSVYYLNHGVASICAKSWKTRRGGAIVRPGAK